MNSQNGHRVTDLGAALAVAGAGETRGRDSDGAGNGQAPLPCLKWVASKGLL